MAGVYRNSLLTLVVLLLCTLPSTTGTGGSPGPPGPAGPPGAAGYPGHEGPRGKVGPGGPLGPAGIAGPPGSAGPRGAAGREGPPGRPGLPGAKGDQGKEGHDGDDGMQGPPGERGLPGPKGPRGYNGERGFIGLSGSTGSHGRSGATGYTGPSGIKGPNGHPGVPGQRGPAGPAGPLGPPGPRGNNGPMGPTGQLGPRGARGERGGPPGPPGMVGPPGRPGGPPGPPGPPGRAGPPGPSGLGNSRDSSGTVVTLSKPANIEIKKGEMSEENKIMLYVALVAHVLWLLLFIILTAAIIVLYKKLKHVQQVIERFTNVSISANGMLTKVGIYEQISNLSCDSSLTNMPGYQKLKQENRRSHSYAEMPSATPVNSLPLPSRAGPSGKTTGVSGIPAAPSGGASTATTTMVNNAVYRDSGSMMTGSDYETPVSGGGTAGSLADADSVILGLRSTGIVVRDLRERFESKELKRNRAIVQTNADEDTLATDSRPQSMITTTEDSSDYTGSQYLRVIPTPEGDSDTLASDMYIDRESRSYVTSVKKKAEDP